MYRSEPEVSGWLLPVTVSPSTYSKRRAGPAPALVVLLLVKVMLAERRLPNQAAIPPALGVLALLGAPPVTTLPVTVILRTTASGPESLFAQATNHWVYWGVIPYTPTVLSRRVT